MNQLKKVTLLLVIGCLPFTSIAQSKEKEKAKPNPDEALVAWKDYMTPGKQHEFMAAANGDWSAEVTMWMAADAPAQKTKGTCSNSMIMGGRYQQSINKMTWDNMPFEGISTTGYDNALKMYVSTWIDNFGTGIMYLEGTYDANNKTINYRGKMVDPVSGKSVPVRETMTFIDDNNSVMEMFITDSGKEYKSMNIKFTRNH